jgi:hypothetical protein
VGGVWPPNKPQQLTALRAAAERPIRWPDQRARHVVPSMSNQKKQLVGMAILLLESRL